MRTMGTPAAFSFVYWSSMCASSGETTSEGPPPEALARLAARKSP
jgi:hypothetical protein